MTLSQTERPLTIATPLDDDTLIARSVSWSERLGHPFIGSLDLVSPRGDLEPMELLRQPVSVAWQSADGDPVNLHGYVNEFSLLGFDRGLYDYRLTLVPWIELLKHAGGSRIFQQQSVVEISKALIESRGFSAELDDRLTQTYDARAYCVQYAESDFHFLSRLWQQEGIYYCFEYSQDQHTLVLCDDVSAHQSVDGLATLPYHGVEEMGSEACLSRWSSGRQFATGSFALRDYDFQKPRAEMTVRQTASDTASNWEWFEFPGRFFETDNGQHFARVRSEAVAAREQQASVHFNTTGLQSGNLFTLQDHPIDERNQQYLVTAAELNLTVPDVIASDRMAAAAHISQRLQIQRSSLPFRNTLRIAPPTVAGPQIATVVGPEGEEIWTDAYGRIKVQFAWDTAEPADDSRSCWIRVTQPWTGKGWGAIAVPRVGEEVIVDFIDGNVDRPIVTGRVFNADRMPPEALADAQSKTVFRTRSTPGGDVECFHELTFDDTKDAESIYLHSERDFKRVVENNDELKVGFEKQDSGDQTIEIYNDQTVAIGVGSGEGSQTIEIGKDRSTTIQSGDDTLTIKQGDRKLAAESGAISIEAATSITLKCGESTLELTPDGIVVKAGSIAVQGQTQASLSAPQISAAADAALDLKAGAEAKLIADGQTIIQAAMVMIN